MPDTQLRPIIKMIIYIVLALFMFYLLYRLIFKPLGGF